MAHFSRDLLPGSGWQLSFKCCFFLTLCSLYPELNPLDPKLELTARVFLPVVGKLGRCVHKITAPPILEIH